MNRLFKYLGLLLLFVLLSILTQIGGIVLLLSLGLGYFLKLDIHFKVFLLFTVSYLLATYLLVPQIAPFFGRERLVHTDLIR